MFITENINKNDSFLFILSARDTLKEMIELSSSENKDKLKDFIVNEASSYQVMSLLVDGKLPEEANDALAEKVIFSQLKEQLIFNYEIISEFVDSNLINNVIFEVDSIVDDSDIESLNEAGVGDIFSWAPKQSAHSSYKKITNVPDLNKPGVEAIKPGVEAIKSGAAAVKKFFTGETAIEKWTRIAGENAGKIGGGVLAALAVYASYKIYQKFFSKAAKACKGDADKKACMAKFKAQALGMQIKEVQKGLSLCSKSKDAAKCKTVINNKIAKLRSKMK